MNNFREKIGVGNIIVDTIFRQTGARYRTPPNSGAEFISGTSGDYAAGQDNIPLVYTIFAPSTGQNGWDVPENQINRIVNEIFVGVERLANYVVDMPMQPILPPPPPIED